MINTNIFNFYYDVEPDYIMNILMIDKFGLPTNLYHPGTIHYFLLNGLYNIFKIFNQNLSEFILSIRVLYFVIGLTIAYSCFRKNSIFILMCYLLVTILTPYSVIGLISGETINFFLSFLILWLVINKKNLIIIGLLFGLMMNIKSSSFLIFPFIVYYELVNYKTIYYNRLLKLLIPSLLVFSSYIFFVDDFSLDPFKFLVQKLFFVGKITHSKYFDFYLLLNDEFKLIYKIFGYLSLASLTISFYWLIMKFKKSIINYVLNKKYILVLSCLVCIGFVLSPIINQQHLVKQFSPIFVFLVYPIYCYLKNLINLKSILFLLAIVLVIMKFNLPIKYEKNSIDNYIVSNHDNLTLYMNPGHWVSEILFLKWTEYLGLGLIDFPIDWTKKFNVKDLSKIHLLINENIECIGKIKNDNHPGLEGTYRKYFSDCPNSFLNNSKSSVLVPKIFNKEFEETKQKIKLLYGYDFIIFKEFSDFFIYKKRASSN